jgi:hypothetical protein
MIKAIGMSAAVVLSPSPKLCCMSVSNDRQITMTSATPLAANKVLIRELEEEMQLQSSTTSDMVGISNGKRGTSSLCGS